VPFNESSYEQTSVMREALETVVRQVPYGEHRRDEIARIILRIAVAITLDPVALTNLTLSEMAGRVRKVG
jgi:hypothetical protein